MLLQVASQSVTLGLEPERCKPVRQMQSQLTGVLSRGKFPPASKGAAAYLPPSSQPRGCLNSTNIGWVQNSVLCSILCSTSSMFSTSEDCKVAGVAEGKTGTPFPGTFCHLRKTDCPRIVGVGARAKRLLGVKNVDGGSAAWAPCIQCQRMLPFMHAMVLFC